jgi:hypothetical protein
METDKGGSAYNGACDTGPTALARQVGWENAEAILTSRTTCWDFME